jgi:hypothetical protein
MSPKDSTTINSMIPASFTVDQIVLRVGISLTTPPSETAFSQTAIKHLLNTGTSTAAPLSKLWSVVGRQLISSLSIARVVLAVSDPQ